LASDSEVLLGLDIGTSSAKAVLTTPDGELLATAERAHDTARPRPGWVEHDAERVWWEAVVALCRELAADGPWPPAAVCVSGLGPCLLPADGDGRPLRPAILYGVDTRAQAEIAELTEQLGADAILARGGSALTTQAVGPKLLWLRRHEPDVWAATRRLLMASSYAVHQLTGEYVLDHHSASQCDPLYDLETGDWHRPWAEAIAPGLPLPRLLWPGDQAGEVSAAAAAATGLRAGTPVAAGTIDAWAEALSAGVHAPGDAMLMYGTTMFFVAVESDPSPDPRLWLTTGVERGTRTVAAGMATSGALTAWLREIAGDVPYDRLLREAAAVPAGADALVALPYFAGERTPVFDPLARGVICGLTLSHGRGHLYRALLEATAYGVRHNLEAFADAGAEPRRLVAVGGGTRGSLWTQIVSDVTGRPQELPAQTIGASYGDALLAGRAAGLVDPGARWNPVAEVVAPTAAAREAYEPLYAIYRDLYPATRAQAHALAAIQEGAPPTGPS
jgi:xylulokinase